MHSIFVCEVPFPYSLMLMSSVGGWEAGGNLQTIASDFFPWSSVGQQKHKRGLLFK
jgi:hypothetical protein